jgi:hypothetical protein
MYMDIICSIRNAVFSHFRSFLVISGHFSVISGHFQSFWDISTLEHFFSSFTFYKDSRAKVFLGVRVQISVCKNLRVQSLQKNNKKLFKVTVSIIQIRTSHLKQITDLKAHVQNQYYQIFLGTTYQNVEHT